MIKIINMKGKKILQKMFEVTIHQDAQFEDDDEDEERKDSEMMGPLG